MDPQHSVFLVKNVKIILCDYSFRADLHVMRYLGFEIDFLRKDWLDHYEAHILCPERTIYLRHPQSVNKISMVLNDFDFQFGDIILFFKPT